MEMKSLPEIDYPAEPLRIYFEHLAGVLMQPEALDLPDLEHDKLDDELAAAIDRIHELPLASISALRARASVACWLTAFGTGDEQLNGVIGPMAAALVPAFAAQVEAHVIRTRNEGAAFRQALTQQPGRPN